MRNQRTYCAESDQSFVTEIGFKWFNLFDEDIEPEIKLLLVEQKRPVYIVLDHKVVVSLWKIWETKWLID